MNIDQMRNAISEAYTSWRWKERVKNMAPNQVVAIYKSFQNKGMFDKTKAKRFPGERYHQMNIFELPSM